jgi:hypothetical protein
VRRHLLHVLLLTIPFVVPPLAAAWVPDDGAVSTAPGTGAFGAITVSPAGAPAVAWIGPADHLRAAIRTRPSAWSSIDVPVSAGAVPDAPAVVTNAAGRIAIAWEERAATGPATPTIHAVVGSLDGIGAAQNLGPGTAPSVAIDDAGRAVVAWTDVAHAVSYAVRPATATAFNATAPALAAGGGSASGANVRVVGDPAGHVYLVMLQVFGSHVRFARLAPGGSAFDVVTDVDGLVGPVSVAAGPDGDLAIAYLSGGGYALLRVRGGDALTPTGVVIPGSVQGDDVHLAIGRGGAVAIALQHGASVIEGVGAPSRTAPLGAIARLDVGPASITASDVAINARGDLGLVATTTTGSGLDSLVGVVRRVGTNAAEPPATIVAGAADGTGVLGSPRLVVGAAGELVALAVQRSGQPVVDRLMAASLAAPAPLAITVRAPASQHLRSGRVAITVRCTIVCTGTATATLTVGGKRFALDPKTFAGATDARVTVSLAVHRTRLRAVLAALARRRGTIAVKVAAIGPAADAATGSARGTVRR